MKQRPTWKEYTGKNKCKRKIPRGGREKEKEEEVKPENAKSVLCISQHYISNSVMTSLWSLIHFSEFFPSYTIERAIFIFLE